MTKRGRPISQEPATVYDYRRMKVLVDTLAEYSHNESKLEKAIEYLAMSWNIEIEHYGNDNWFNLVHAIGDLAKHVLEHGRDGKE